MCVFAYLRPSRVCGHAGGVGVKVSVKTHVADDPLMALKHSGDLQAILKAYGKNGRAGTMRSARGPPTSAASAPLALTARTASTSPRVYASPAPRSARWLSAAGREEAAREAGLNDIAKGPVAKP